MCFLLQVKHTKMSSRFIFTTLFSCDDDIFCHERLYILRRADNRSYTLAKSAFLDSLYICIHFLQYIILFLFSFSQSFIFVIFFYFRLIRTGKVTTTYVGLKISNEIDFTKTKHSLETTPSM